MTKFNNNIKDKLLGWAWVFGALILLACTQGGGGADLSLDANGSQLAQPAEHPSAGRGLGDPTDIPEILQECEVVGFDDNGEPIEKCHPRNFPELTGVTDLEVPSQVQEPQAIREQGPLNERAGFLDNSEASEEESFEFDGEILRRLPRAIDLPQDNEEDESD